VAYIGRQSIIGNFVKLDSITVVNGQAAYTMQNGGSNFTDYESVNQFLVSLNGIIQAPTDSFTVSGSTLTFASNLATGDVIDFVMVFGNSLSAGTPTDATVTTAKLAADAVTEAKIADGAVESEHLNNNIISGQTELATAPADTDEFLISDAGTLKRIDASLVVGGDVKKLISGTLSSASSLALSSTYITSTYQYYDLLITGYSSTNNFQTGITTSTNNGTSYAGGSSDYGWCFTSTGSQAGYASIADQDDTGVVINDEQSDGAALGFAHRVRITNPMSSVHATQFQWTGVGHHQTNDDVKPLYGVGFRQAVEQNNNIRVSFSQTVTGSYVLYGIKGS